MKKIALYGDTGMVGQELDKVLTGHDGVEVAYRQNSRRQEGDLSACDLAFLATKDPESMTFAPEAVAAGLKVVDMSGAFRLPVDRFEAGYGLKHTATDLLEESVYGMPAIYADEIAGARVVGNPGCYPTSVILALRPLEGLVQGEATVVSTSGNSGARQEIEEESNELTYSFGRKHKHVPEMEIYSGRKVNFTPIVLRSVFAGINTNIRIALSPETAALGSDEAAAKLRAAIADAYVPDDLVHVVEDTAEKQWGTRDVVGTHKLVIKLGVDDGHAYINALEDNLGKGAASQGVENMNLMLGFERLRGIAPAYRVA